MTSGDFERPAHEPTSVAAETLNAAGLARILHLSVATVRADISRRPWTLPPSIKIGTKTVWLYSTVLEWLKGRERAITKPASPESLTRRRGRPTKAEQVAERHASKVTTA